MSPLEVLSLVPFVIFDIFDKYDTVDIVTDENTKIQFSPKPWIVSSPTGITELFVYSKIELKLRVQFCKYEHE